MITFYEGRPGNYKSYSACKRSLHYLGNGGVVGGNLQWIVPACREYLRKRYKWELQDNQLIPLDGRQLLEFWKYIPAGTKEFPSAVFLEEAGRFWNAREWANTGKALLDFLALHRHEFTDIYLIDQSSENVDKQFRRLVSQYHVFRNLKEATRGLVPVNLVCDHVYEYDHRTKMDLIPFFPEAEIFKTYNSYCREVRVFERADGVGHFGDKGKIKKKGVMSIRIIWAVVLAVVLGIGGYGFYSFSHGGLLAPKAARDAASREKAKALVSVDNSAVSDSSAEKPKKGPVSGSRCVGFRAYLRSGDNAVVQTDDGLEFYKGKLCPEGIVKAVTKDCVLIVDSKGVESWIIKN